MYVMFIDEDVAGLTELFVASGRKSNDGGSELGEADVDPVRHKLNY